MVTVTDAGRQAANRAGCGAAGPGRWYVRRTVGPLGRQAAAAFGNAGRSFADTASLGKAAEAMLAEDVTLLVKGSRIMGLDQLVSLLTSDGMAGAETPC